MRPASAAVVVSVALAAAAVAGPALADALVLKDGRRVEGDIEFAAGTARAGDARVRLAEIASVEGGPPRLRAALLVDAFLREKDDARAEAIARSIAALSLPAADLASAVREGRTGELPPPGVVTRETIVRLDRSVATVHVVVPASAPRGGELAPLLVAMHGTSGNGADVARFYRDLAERHGLVVACPTATFNRDKGWGATDAERSLPLSLVRELLIEWPIDPDRVYSTGWSMGGHATWDVALHAPDRFAALMPVIGGPFFRYWPILGNLLGTPIHDIQGADDDPDLVAAQRQGVERLRALGHRDLVYDEVPGRGHEFFDDRIPAALESVVSKRREPYPRKVRLATINEKFLGNAWVEIEKLAAEAWLPGRPLHLKSAAPKDEAKKQKVFREAMEAQAGRIEASVESPTRIVVKTRGVESYSLLLSDELVALDKDITVVTNGNRSFQGKPARDPLVLLRRLRENGDRSRLVAAEIRGLRGK